MARQEIYEVLIKEFETKKEMSKVVDEKTREEDLATEEVPTHSHTHKPCMFS